MTHKIYLAPIRGCTDAVFRTSYARHFSGIDSAIAPFFDTKGSDIKPAHVRRLLPENNTGLAVVPQAMTNSPEDFVCFAHRLHDLGYDTLNWNLGCPHRQNTKRLLGAGLLPDPERIASFLDTVMTTSPLKVSIKMRLGLDGPEEILQVLPVLDRYPLTEIIIHPRTAGQLYGGEVNLNIFSRCLSMTTLPVVYNGDITSPDYINRLVSMFPQVSGWMIGRGVLADPFLPGLIKGCAPVNNSVEIVRTFHDDLYEGYSALLSGPSHIVDKMKGFWVYLSGSFEGGEKLTRTIRRAKRVNEYRLAVDSFFEASPCWKGLWG